jgi:transposase
MRVAAFLRFFLDAQMANFLRSRHVAAFETWNGLPRVLLHDNLKSAVIERQGEAIRFHPTLLALGAHYRFEPRPVAVVRGNEKAKAERGVLVVERWILARLRHQQFFSLAALNAAIAAGLDVLNTRPFKKLEGSRRTHFEAIDRPALRALPARPYAFAEWRKARVAPNIHIEVDGHSYSVPHTVVKRQLDVRLSAATVEVFHHGQRVAAHPRSPRRGGSTTVKEHMPEAHRRYLDWSPARLLRWGQQIGPATGAVLERLLAARTHPQQAFNACFGVLRLATGFDAPRLEAAGARALDPRHGERQKHRRDPAEGPGPASPAGAGTEHPPAGARQSARLRVRPLITPTARPGGSAIPST